MRSVVIAAIALAATAPAAGATPPVRGSLYSGSAPGVGSLSFSVSKDGKRVFNVVGRDAALRCPRDSRVTTVDLEALPYPESVPVRRGGTFRVKSDPDAGLSVAVTGRFGPGGTVTGVVRYRESTSCGGSGRFTGSVAPSRGGTKRRVFGLGASGTDAFDLPGGAIGLQEQQEDFRAYSYSLNRVDLRGRDTQLGDLGGDFANDVLGLADGSIIYTRSSGCIRIRSAAGKVRNLVGRCDLSPPALVPAYITPVGGGSYVFSDGGTTGDAEDNTRLVRLAPNGTITPLAPVAGVNGGLATERDGSVLVSTGNRVLRVSPAGVVTVAAGTGSPRFSGDGGPATAAGMAPGSVVAQPGGGFLFVDSSASRIREVSPAGIVTTFAGAGEAGTGAAGRDLATPFPTSLDSLRDGTVVFSDVNGTKVIPGPQSKRLLVGLPETPQRYRALVRARRSVAVALTRRARVKLVIRRGKRRVASIARTLPAGTSRVAVPRRARVRGKGTLSLAVSARAGGARASDSRVLR